MHSLRDKLINSSLENERILTPLIVTVMSPAGFIKDVDSTVCAVCALLTRRVENGQRM